MKEVERKRGHPRRAIDRRSRALELIDRARADRGEPLARATRRDHERFLGDLSDVRVHVGPAAARAAEALGALAYTDGRDVHFGSGASRGDAAGAVLLAHELAHAAQARARPEAADRLVADEQDPAERDADHVVADGVAPAARARARVHCFPNRRGLTASERVPPPLLLHVVEHRFQVAVEVAIGEPTERDVELAVRFLGEEAIAGDDVVDRTVRIGAGQATRPVAAAIIRVAEAEVWIDLYGDGRDIVKLSDNAAPDGRNRGIDHELVVSRNDLRTGSTTVNVAYPRDPLVAGETTPTASRPRGVTEVMSFGGDDFAVSASRLGRRDVAFHIELSPYQQQQQDKTWFLRDIAPAGDLTVDASTGEGRYLDFDLTGDGQVDLRLDHRMGDWQRTTPPATGRTHWFDPYDANGVRIGARAYVVSTDAQDQAPRPPIPEAQRIPEGSDPSTFAEEPGAPPPLDEAVAPHAIPGQVHSPVRWPDGRYSLQVDGDGDRRAELLLLFRPRDECRADGLEEIDLDVVQLSSRARGYLTFAATSEQRAALMPELARAADGNAPAMIDVVPRFRGRVLTDPLPLALWPPSERCGMLAYPIDIGHAQYEIWLPLEEGGAAPELVRERTDPERLGGFWTVDAVFGEYGDRFRFTLEVAQGRHLLGVSVLERAADGDTVIRETRAVRLVPGAAAVMPAHVSTDPQEFSLDLGPWRLHVTDAIMGRPGRDPHTVRTHTMTIFGTAVEDQRRIQFECPRQHMDYVALDRRENLSLPQNNGPGASDRRHIRQQGNLLAGSLRAALDQGWLREAVYEAWRDAQVAMLWLQYESAVDARGGEAPDLPARIERARRLLLALRDSDPLSMPLAAIPSIVSEIDSHNWGRVSSPRRGTGAFGEYTKLIVNWNDDLDRRSAAQTDARDISAATAAVETLRGQSHERATMEGLILQYDAAIAAQVVTAHSEGLLGDSLYNAWDRLRRTIPLLRAQADAERDGQECLPDGGRIEQAATDAEILQRELHAAIEAAEREEDLTTFTGEVRDDQHTMARAIVPRYLNGYGTLLAANLRARNWTEAFERYEALMGGVDQWVTDRIRDHYDADSNEYRNNAYLHRMRERIVDRAGRPGARPVAGTFAPDSQYHGVSGGITAIPLTLVVFRSGGDWHLHDLTPDDPYECSVPDRGEDEPPHELFAKLNDRDRFPKGILYYQVPGGEGGRVRCTAEKEWHDWARDIGLGLALIGITLATAGTGTVAVAGAWFLAGAAAVNAVAAAGELHDTVTSGQATTTSVVLNILDIVASLAGAGSLISGTVVRSATTAARAGMAWTGAAARVAAFADRAYIPLTATGVAGDVATVAVMSYDVKEQLDALEESGASEQEIASARKGLLLQLAVTGGLTALSVRGDLPEIRTGRRDIVLDVVGDVAIARAAGVRLRGVDLNLPTNSARSHAAARWHARDVELGRVDLGDDVDDFHEWHRRWLEMPERVSVDTDGNLEVHLPVGPDGALPPDSVQGRLRAMAGPESDIAQAERAFAIGDEVASLERTGARVDPLDPDWPTTRRSLVERLGGGRRAERMVRQFEHARLGAAGDAEAYIARRRQVNRILHDSELEQISALFPGQQVYVTGAPVSGAELGRDVDRVRVDVVAPPGATPDQMAAMEQRGDLLRLRPDPAFLQANDLDPNHTIALEVRVVPADAFVGVAATGGPLLRIDNPLATRRVELAAILEHHLASMSTTAPDYRVEVLSVEDFRERFGSENRGRSVFRLEDGQPVIYARPDASPADMLDETSHLAQLHDSDMARRIRTLDQINLHDWQSASAQHRLEMFQTKLTVEIDAKERTLASLRGQGDGVAPDIAEVERQLEQLRALQTEIAGITPEQLGRMNAGAIALPSYLEHPPWLFGRRSVIEGIRPNRFRIDPRTRRTVLPDTGPARSAARNREGVRRVRRVGNSWTERTIVSTDVDGRVVSIETVEGRGRIVTVERPESAGGARFTYTVGADAELRVREGSSVDAGEPLAEEAREYRLVEIDYGGGRTDFREEIRMRDESLGWRQRGSESTFRGALMEDAARRQIELDLRADTLTGRLTHSMRIPHSRGGGGFDHVFVEFTGTGTNTQATIRIIEVKDYPGRSVPLEDFSAIRGSGLEDNLDILKLDIDQALDAVAEGGRATGVYADLSIEQLTALSDAARRPGGVRVEVMVGPGTRIGAEGHHASTVLPRLRSDIEDELGPGSLVLSEAGTPTLIEPTHVTAAAEAVREEALRSSR